MFTALAKTDERPNAKGIANSLFMVCLKAAVVSVSMPLVSTKHIDMHNAKLAPNEAAFKRWLNEGHRSEFAAIFLLRW